MRISVWSSDLGASDLAPPDAGITIATANSSVVNSGTISGAGTGITTAYLFDEEIGELVFLAAGTTVENSGTIACESNDGVRSDERREGKDGVGTCSSRWWPYK